MQQKLEFGASVDMLTKGELSDSLAAQTQEIYRQFARGVKYLRFGPVPVTIANSAFSLDGTSVQGGGLGPREGFVWAIRRLLVTGLGTGATPDAINFYRGTPDGVPIWQLNGNQFGETFSNVSLLLLPGEVLSFANVGSVTATGQVTVSGDVVECAAEELVKIL